jgi:hypothetical protein
MDKEYKGYKATLILTDSGVIIRQQGGIRVLLRGDVFRGDKTIPYSSIVATQLKKAGLLLGYLQLTLIGGSDAKGGSLQALKDENTINFYNRGENNELFAEAKEIIETKMKEARGGSVRRSAADDIEKYAGLRDRGVISEEEFQAKKKQLLAIN